MKKQTSDRKIESNRQNAKRSTGPQTAAGKKAVRHNAVKRGLLATDIVIETGTCKESRQEFDDLMQALRDDLAPVGFTEEMLVEKIGVSAWRARRAVRSESAEVSTQMDTYHEQRRIEEERTVRDMLEDTDWPGDGLESRLLETATGTEYMLERVEDFEAEIKTQGFFDSHTRSQACHLFGRYQGSYGQQLAFAGDYLKLSPRDTTDASDDSEAAILGRQFLLETLAAKRRQFAERLRSLHKRANTLRGAELASLWLPEADALAKIQRYQTTNDRELYRALRELRRLQTERKDQ